MELRPYQQNSIRELYSFLKGGQGLNPCLVLPTGAGKSVVIAKIASDFYRANNDKMLVLAPVKELIEQNYNKLKQFIDPSDLGMYSSGLGVKQLNKRITVAGIQSIYNAHTPDYKVIIADECHLINTKEVGQYRQFLSKFPNAMIIGLTATPYRMDNGFINSGDTALFNELIIPEGTTIQELVNDGYLAKLKSKVSDAGHFDFKNVKKSQGDFNQGQVDKIINHFDAIDKVVSDVIERTKDFKHVLVFCQNIDHSINVSQALCDKGQKSFYVHGKMSKSDRSMAIDSFRGGLLKYLCNPNILTTGFDFPNIDCVVMLRPTFSVVLYVQMAGRGLRLKSHTDHCTILDYVGNIERNGTIINPKIKGKKEASDSKICPACLEVNAKDAEICVDCGHVFNVKKPKEDKEEEDEEKTYALYNLDIMYDDNAPEELVVIGWNWKKYTKKGVGNGILCEFYTPEKTVPMYLAVYSEKAKHAILGNLKKILQDGRSYSVTINPLLNTFSFWFLTNEEEYYHIDDFCELMNTERLPKTILVKKSNNFYQFLKINY